MQRATSLALRVPSSRNSNASRKGDPQELLDAARAGDVPKVRALLQEHRDWPNSLGHQRALAEAAKTGNVELLRVLLDHGPPRLGWCTPSALYLAAQRRDDRVVEALLSHGADPEDMEEFLRPAPDESTMDYLRSMLLSHKSAYHSEIVSISVAETEID